MIQATNAAFSEEAVQQAEAFAGVDDRLQRLATLDRLSSQLVFTDVRKAQKYLAEQHLLLSELKQPDFELNYHLSTALIENQLYNYDLAEIHFQKALEILSERGDATQLAEAYIDYAGTLHNLGKNDKAREHLAEASKFLKTFPDGHLQARLSCMEGYLHLKNSNSGKALHSFLEAERRMKFLEKQLDLKDYYFITMIQSSLGTIYGQNQEPEKSIKAYRQVVELCEKKGMRSRLSWHYLKVGNGYVANSDDDNAMHYFREAIKVIDDVNQQARALAFANLGYCCFRRGAYKEALEWMEKAHPLFKEEREKNLANIELWRAKICQDQDKRKKAGNHYYNALRLARQGEDYKQITGILKEIATWHAEAGEYQEAYGYQRLYEQAMERYFIEVKVSEIKELEIKYEADRKEKEMEMLKLQATGLQLKALRAQMNPHFVFNALNSVQNFITSSDTSGAAKYLAQFAHLMRQSLEYSDLEIISLEKEIDFLRNYLEINEKLRFENKLSYKIEVDEEIEEDIYGVPTMIVQPYVENAIEHGIRPKKKGLIRVFFTLKDEDTILCIVEDNGVGREKARQNQESNPNFKNHKSLGTKITQDRLEILQKSRDRKEAVVTIHDLKNEKTGEALGTRVEILIPIVEIQMK